MSAIPSPFAPSADAMGDFVLDFVRRDRPGAISVMRTLAKHPEGSPFFREAIGDLLAPFAPAPATAPPAQAPSATDAERDAYRRRLRAALLGRTRGLASLAREVKRADALRTVKKLLVGAGVLGRASTSAGALRGEPRSPLRCPWRHPAGPPTVGGPPDESRHEPPGTSCPPGPAFRGRGLT